jgi:hypothetical protein
MQSILHSLLQSILLQVKQLHQVQLYFYLKQSFQDYVNKEVILPPSLNN